MKKRGFTLAEVLVTLGIIGVVSAVTLPTLMSNSAYKQLGVKLSKFQSTLENTALAWVTSDREFASGDTDYTSDFINNSYIFKEVYGSDGNKQTNTTLSLKATSTCPQKHDVVGISGYPWGVLKDGTAIAVCQPSTGSAGGQAVGFYPTDKYGNSVFRISIQPNVNGIPADGQKVYEFLVTQKGYVFPVTGQDCLNILYENNWNVNGSWFRNNGKCTKSSWSTSYTS